MTDQPHANQIVFREMTPEKKLILDRASFVAFENSGLQPRSWRQAYYHSRFIDICQWELDGFDPAKRPDWLPPWLLKFLDSVQLEKE